MNARAINLTVVAVVNGEATTTSLAIADGTDNDHASVIKLVRTYQADLEEFGRVGFEIRPFETAGGTQKQEFAILNEPQSTLIMTYMRNSEIVRTFKKRLVKEFWELARAAHAGRIAAQPPKNALRQLEPATLTKAQQGELYNRVADKVRNGGKTNSYYWSKLLARFRVSSYKHIQATQFDAAVDFLTRFEGGEDPLLMFTTAELTRLVQEYVDKALAAHKREQPLHGCRMVVRFEAGGHYSVQPLTPDLHVLDLDTYEELYLRKLAKEGKAIVMQSAVDAIRAIANINLGA